MKFLIDAQLPPGLRLWFELRNIEAVHVNDIGLGSASDIEIALYVVSDGFILISKDEDFLTIRLPDRFVLLWLRCGNTTNRALTVWMDERWARVALLLANGERLIELR